MCLRQNENESIMPHKLFIPLFVASLLFFGCDTVKEDKTSYDLTNNGFEIVTHEEGDSNLVEQYYLDGSLKGLGIRIYRKREGRWIEFYPNGDTMWDGYYSADKRLYPTNFHLFRDSTLFQTDYHNDQIIHAGEIIKFNFKNNQVHPDEIELVSLHNCEITRLDPFLNSGYSFQMKVGQSNDSASFDAEARVFLAWPIRHFKVLVN